MKARSCSINDEERQEDSMGKRFIDRFRQQVNRLTGFESLESRRVMDCYGLGSVEVCVLGDSNADGQFDQQDLVRVFQAGKYQTADPADWAEGDWNQDSKFDSGDLVAVFQAGTYLQGKLIDDLSPLVARSPGNSGALGPPVTITNTEQLIAAIHDTKAVDAIAAEVDFDHQSLLLFSWSGSGGDSLIGQQTVVDGVVDIKFQFEFGFTRDLRQHQSLFAVPRNTTWNIDVERRVIQTDTTGYEFDLDQSRFIVSGGFAGFTDEYQIEGPITLVRNSDGSASFRQVEAILRGSGRSSLDGKTLDSVLSLSELTGLQTLGSSMVFAGFSASQMTMVRLFVSVDNGTLTIRGGDLPPCCDFIQHEINAVAST